MRIKKLCASYIWQARQELGYRGTQDDDWYIAERFLIECGDEPFTYEIIYDWVQKNLNMEGKLK